MSILTSAISIWPASCRVAGGIPGQEADKKWPVSIGLPNEEGYPHQGQLDFASISLTSTTGTLLMRGVFPNPAGKILPGLYARVRVPLKKKTALLVPEVAIANDQQGSYVLIVNEKDVVERRGVKTGPTVDNLRVIEEGLHGKEWIIVNGLLRAAPGRQVTPEREGVAPPGSGFSSNPSPKEGEAMISRFFIERPIFANVIALVTIIIGLIFLYQLPVAQYPQIVPPTIQVSTRYPGASAEVVAATIAVPIEQAVNGVEGSIYMSSTSGSDGSYALTITFNVGTDLTYLAGLGPEPGQQRLIPASGRCSAAGGHGQKGFSRTFCLWSASTPTTIDSTRSSSPITL